MDTFDSKIGGSVLPKPIEIPEVMQRLAQVEENQKKASGLVKQALELVNNSESAVSELLVRGALQTMPPELADAFSRHMAGQNGTASGVPAVVPNEPATNGHTESATERVALNGQGSEEWQAPQAEDDSHVTGNIPTAREVVVDFAQMYKGERFTKPELVQFSKDKYGEAPGDSALNQALSALTTNGSLKRVSMGVYKLANAGNNRATSRERFKGKVDKAVVLSEMKRFTKRGKLDRQAFLAHIKQTTGHEIPHSTFMGYIKELRNGGVITALA